MKLMLNAFAAAAALLLVSGVALASSVASIEGTASGTTGLTLDNAGGNGYPVVTAILSQPGTAGSKTYTSWSFLVNDGTGSVDVYASATALTGLGYTPTVGDALSITSLTNSPYHQIPEVNITSGTTLSRISTGNAVAAPILTTISQIPTAAGATLPSSLAGYMVELDNVTIGGISGTFGTGNLTGTIADGTGSMALYYWPTSYNTNPALYNQAIPTGAVDMTGFVSEYPGSAPEFTPLTITAAPEPATMSLLGLGLVGLIARKRKNAR